MSDDIKFGLTDLEISDDLDVSLDNDTYQDQANPAPPAYGDYLLRTITLNPLRYRGGENKGEPILQDGKYPKFELGMAEIVEGLGDGVTRKVGLFTAISTKPYVRDDQTVSQLGDFARAYGLGNYTNLAEAIALLQEAVEGRQTFGATIDWESGYDKEFVEAAMEQLGLAGIERSDYTDEQRKLANIINYRLARVQGMKNFPYNPSTGRFSPIVHRGNVTLKHPTTGAELVVEVAPRTLEARAIIPVYFNDMKFIPRERVDSGRVTFGPRNVKPVSQAAQAA